MEADKLPFPPSPVPLPPDRGRLEMVRAKANLADRFLFALLLFMPVTLALHLETFRKTGQWPLRLGLLLAMYAVVAVLCLFRKRIDYPVRIHILLSVVLVLLVHHGFRVGPMAPLTLALSLVVPWAAGMLLGIRTGWAYTWAISAIFFLGAWLDVLGRIPPFPGTVGWESRRVWDYWLPMAFGVPVVCGIILCTTRRLFEAWEKVAADLASEMAERARLQEQLLQARKLESVGRLAGGIAHDLNTMISVVLSHTDLIELELLPDDPLRQNLEHIRQVGLRSSGLMRQLLVFARKDPGRPVEVELNGWIQETRRLLAPLVGSAIQVRFEPGDDLGKVSVDPSHLDQIVVNLVVNARDAMPHGGMLTLRTVSVRITEEDCRVRPGLVPGVYVQLNVTDQGTGMDPEILDHIFEPYFTTKDPGKGTGLGLATVYGIVRQAGGFIEVQSQPSAGTTFRVFLPACSSSVQV